MKRYIATFVMFVLIVSCLENEADAFYQTESAGSEFLVIQNVSVIPMDRPRRLPNHTVIIQGNRITAVTPTADAIVPKGSTVIDGRGKFLIPGLADMHVHLFTVDDLDLMLMHGVTTALNMSGSPWHLKLARSIGSGKRRGPTLYSTGPQLKRKAQLAVDTEITVDGIEEIDEIIRSQKELGYDFVKVWDSFPPLTYQAIMSAARRHQIRVTGHIPRAVGLEGCIREGQDSIAHVEEYFNKVFGKRFEPAALPSVVALTAESKIPVITTLSTYEVMIAANQPNVDAFLDRSERSLVDPVRQLTWQPKWNRFRKPGKKRLALRKEALKSKLAITKGLHEGGVMLLCGTDAGEIPGLVPGFHLHEEMQLMSQAKLSNYDILATVTRNPGEYLKHRDRFGLIKAGYRADLVLLNSNPLEKIENTKTIAGVVVRGVWYTRKTLDGLGDQMHQRHELESKFVDNVVSQDASTGISFYEQLKRNDPKAFVASEWSILYLAYLHALRGDNQNASLLAQLAVREYPESYRPQYTLGAALLMAGKPNEAITFLNRALELSPNHPGLSSLIKQAK